MTDDGKVIPFAAHHNGPVNVVPEIGAAGFGNFGAGLEAMDVETFLNIRDWVQRACEAQGAKMVGAGIGFGQADLDIEIEGHLYNISIKPVPRP
jgi:hypothetical protein